MTFIIAEVGSNWTNFEDCIESIVAAKECGADAVKFQMYTHKELYGYDEDISLPINQTRHPRKLPSELPRDWVPILHTKCQEVSIEFMCTAFSPEGYRFIDPYVKRHKIASAENTDKSILETVSRFGKPIIVSTGGSSLDDLVDVLENLGFTNEGSPDVTLTYCVASYPSRNVDLNKIALLAINCGLCSLGYSCHTTEWVTPCLANNILIDERLSVIEKHFKIREMDTPDNPHSILPENFSKMVYAIRNDQVEEDLPHPDEADFIKYSKRRWIPELNGYYRTKKP